MLNIPSHIATQLKAKILDFSFENIITEHHNQQNLYYQWLNKCKCQPLPVINCNLRISHYCRGKLSKDRTTWAGFLHFTVARVISRCSAVVLQVSIFVCPFFWFDSYQIVNICNVIVIEESACFIYAAGKTQHSTRAHKYYFVAQPKTLRCMSHCHNCAFLLRARIDCIKFFSLPESSPVVGSSRKKSLGSVRISTAMFARFPGLPTFFISVALCAVKSSILNTCAYFVLI